MLEAVHIDQVGSNSLDTHMDQFQMGGAVRMIYREQVPEDWTRRHTVQCLRHEVSQYCRRTD